MAQNADLQVRYSELVEAKLRATSIFSQLFNHRYEGEPKAGAVKIPVRAEATAAAYTIATGVSIAVPTTSYQTLVLDNDYAVNELIDGYYASAVPDGLIADRLDSAGYAIAHQLDSDLVATLKANAQTASTSAADEVKAIIETIAEARTANVDPNSIWVAVSAEAYGKIYTSDMFVTMGNVSDLRNGQIGTIMGTPIYSTTNLTGKEFIVGNSDFCHCVEEWAVPVSVNDLADGAHIGASAVQGRIIYGYCVSKPNTIFAK